MATHRIAEEEADHYEPAELDPKEKAKWDAKQSENANWIIAHTGPHSFVTKTISSKGKKIKGTVAYNPLSSQEENYQIFYEKCGKHPDCYAICNYIEDEEEKNVCADEFNAADQTKRDERVSKKEKPNLLQQAQREKELLAKYLENQRKTEERLNKEKPELEKRRLAEKKEWDDMAHAKRDSRGYPALSPETLKRIEQQRLFDGFARHPRRKLKITITKITGERAGGKSFKKRSKTKTVSKKKNGSRTMRKRKGTRISHRRTKRL